MASERETAALRRRLKDTGCSDAAILRFFDQPELQRALLEKQRQRLLDGIRRRQKQIDCLDYLVWQMEKQEQETGGFTPCK